MEIGNHTEFDVNSIWNKATEDYKLCGEWA